MSHVNLTINGPEAVLSGTITANGWLYHLDPARRPDYTTLNVVTRFATFAPNGREIGYVVIDTGGECTARDFHPRDLPARFAIAVPSPKVFHPEVGPVNFDAKQRCWTPEH